MTIGMNLRNILSASMLAAAMVAALIVVSDGAQASTSSAAAEGVYVCNTASGNGGGGELIVPDGLDPQGAHKNSAGLKAKKSGNYNAAVHSRALALCTVPAEAAVVGGDGVVVPPPTSGSGLSGGDNG